MQIEDGDGDGVLDAGYEGTAWLESGWSCMMYVHKHEA